MSQIKPITDLHNTTEIYEELMDIAQTDAAITEAENEFEAEGVLLDAKEAINSLWRKHFG